MPNGNGMGPAGAGPKTGRGMGRCNGSNAADPQAGNAEGRRCGGGCRMGRGFGRGAAHGNGGVSLQRELEALRMQVAALGRQLAEKKCEA